MSQAETGNVAPTHSLLFIAGKIKAVRPLVDAFGVTRVGTLVVCDPVEGSPRSMVEVFSDTSLGAVGVPVRVKCRLTGAPNSFPVTDDHGQKVMIHTARHYLNAVQ